MDDLAQVGPQAGQDLGERIARQDKQASRWRTAKPDAQAAHEQRPGKFDSAAHALKSVEIALGGGDTGIRAIARKLDGQEVGEAKLSVTDLYRSYKNSPHHPTSTFLKYLVHRVNNVDAYEDPGEGHKLDLQFMATHQVGKAREKNGHLSAADLHKWSALHSARLVPGLIAERDRVQGLVRAGMGLSTRDIDGRTHVALTRGLNDDLMNREHALSSFADKPYTGFGKYMHHTWAPLKDLWWSFDLGDQKASGSSGPEDEFLLAHTAPRYEATEQDIKQLRGKYIGARHSATMYGQVIPPTPHAAFTDVATDDQIADAVRWNEKYGSVQRPMELLHHKNAGPKTLAAFMENLPPDGMGWLVGSRAMPRETALAYHQKLGISVLTNPNLTKQDLVALVPSIKTDADVYSFLNNPQADSKMVEGLWDRNKALFLRGGQNTVEILNSPLTTPRMLQEATDAVAASKGEYEDVALARSIIVNPRHTPEQAEALWRWSKTKMSDLKVSSFANLPQELVRKIAVTATTAPKKLAPEDQGLYGKDADPKDAQSRASVELTNIIMENPFVDGPTLRTALKANHWTLGAFSKRLEKKGELPAEVQGPFVQAVHSITSRKKDELPPAVAESYLCQLASSKGLTQETVNLLAHDPSRSVRDTLYRNKTVPARMLDATWPKGLERPDTGSFNHLDDDGLPLAMREEQDPMDQLAIAIQGRYDYDSRKKREHLIKPFPLHLAKGEEMWNAQVRKWLHDRTKQQGYYFSTNREHAINLLRDGFIAPQFTEELLDGKAVFAHPASPEVLKDWQKGTDGDDALVYFETPTEPTGKHGRRSYWTDILPIENARIADIHVDEGLAKSHPPLQFPGIGVGDDRRDVVIADTKRQEKMATRVAAGIGLRAQGPEAVQGLSARHKSKLISQGAQTLKDYAGYGLTTGTDTEHHAFVRGDALQGKGALRGEPKLDVGASALHEGMHAMLARVQQKHGRTGRLLLAANMLSALPEHYRQAIDDYATKRNHGKVQPEEQIASVLSYLNDPRERNWFHAPQQHSEDKVREFSTQMKRAYEALRAVAATADERWISTRNPWERGEGLAKMNGPLVFPRLGLPDDRRESYIVPQPSVDPTPIRTKAHAFSNLHVREGVGQDAELAKLRTAPAVIASVRNRTAAAVEKDKSPGLAATNAGSSLSYSLAGAPGPRGSAPPSYSGQEFTNDKRAGGVETLLGTKPHEDLHLMLNRVDAKYGTEGRYKLVSNLIQAIPSQNRDDVLEYARKRQGPGVMDPAGTTHEEALTYLTSYLNDPAERRAFHRRRTLVHTGAQPQRFADNVAEMRRFQTSMKRAYRAVRAAAAVATPAWTRIDKPWEYRNQVEPQGDFSDVARDAGPEALPTDWDEGTNPKPQARQWTGKFVAKEEAPMTKAGVKAAIAGVALAMMPGSLNSQPYQIPHKPLVQPVQVEPLHPHLHAIRHLESADGTMLNHAPNSKGEYHTAFGDVAMKPSTAHDVWKGTPKLQSRFPGLSDPNIFTSQFKKMPALYNAVVNTHWGQLLRSFGNNTAKAAFAWRHGRTAAASAMPHDIRESPYVRKFQKVLKAKSKPTRVAMAKAESDVNFVLQAEAALDPHEVDNALEQLGDNPVHHKAMEAAWFLVGRRQPIDADTFRMALSVHGGDVNRAALYAVGLEDSEKNLKALAAALKLGDWELSKAEPQTPVINSVQAANPEGQEAADAVMRAVTAGTIQGLALKGKHAGGATAAKDPQTGFLWLLKPGSGKQSPAAGARDDQSSQSAREACYYHVAKLVGLGGLHPEAQLLLVNAQQWACLRFLPSFKPLDERNRQMDGYAREVLKPYLDRGDLHRLATLAWVLGDPDQHGQNVLVHAEAIVSIDHGSAFAGSNFDPGHDPKSYIPYVLRVFSADGLAKLPPEERIRSMPTMNHEVDGTLRDWVASIKPEEVLGVLRIYGIGEPAQKAVLARLHQVQSHSGDSLSAHVNGLWAGVA